VIPLTRAIPERIRGGYDDALYKSTFTLIYFICIFMLSPPDSSSGQILLPRNLMKGSNKFDKTDREYSLGQVWFGYVVAKKFMLTPGHRNSPSIVVFCILKFYKSSVGASRQLLKSCIINISLRSIN